MSCNDPINQSQYPIFAPCQSSPPVLPSAWTCSALLHPFSPLQSNSTQADKESPFFELCTAIIQYKEGEYFNAYITGESQRTWIYEITPDGTTVSMNGGNPQPIDIGWSLPTPNWFGDNVDYASCAGNSPLNWMDGPNVSWWKIPVGDPNAEAPPATWMWFKEDTNIPLRLMFGQAPPAPSMGDPGQLAFFQMFSFTYITEFSSSPGTMEKVLLASSSFSFGNPNNYDLFTWNTNFGMTVFMTPVNEKFNPLPTRVLYVWKPDGEYHVTSDRSQSTLMKYTYNPSNPFTSQVALLTGPAPKGVTPPPNSGTGFLINYHGDEVIHCQGHGQFPFGQEPPDWVQIPAVQGTIRATMSNIADWCPNEMVTVVSVLFPPAAPPFNKNYPDSTYLWTWYSPFNPAGTGTNSRPVTFMQSQSQLGKGTSLALADYFYYDEFNEPIDPCNFAIPPSCDQSK